MTAWTDGSLRLSAVTMRTPVSTVFGTGFPCRWSTIVFTLRYPMFTGFCTTNPEVALRQRLDEREL